MPSKPHDQYFELLQLRAEVERLKAEIAKHTNEYDEWSALLTDACAEVERLTRERDAAREYGERLHRALGITSASAPPWLKEDET